MTRYRWCELAQDGYGATLLLDGSWLDSPRPLHVGDDKGEKPLGDDPYVRVRMTTDEALELWQLLDRTVGETWRAGGDARRVFAARRVSELDGEARRAYITAQLHLIADRFLEGKEPRT